MAINDISLTSGMRSNLISLQATVDLLNRTQERLSTGKKVNTALDNPLNFFTAKALNSRAADLAGFKDGMSEAVQTIKAANTGITAIEGLLAQAKAIAATAKAGSEAGGTGSVSNITVDLASVTNGQTINVGTQTFTAVATDGHLQKTISFSSMTQGISISIGSTTYVASVGGTSAGTAFVITGNSLSDANSFLTLLTTSIGATSGSSVVLNYATSLGTVSTTGSATQSYITSATVSLGTTEFYIGTGTTTAGSTDAVTASNLAAKINGYAEVAASSTAARINILSGSITITAGTVAETVGTMDAVAYQPTTDRTSYAGQFDDIMTQLDLLATDSNYKGINFLAAGSTLDVEFGTDTGDKITLTGFSAAATSLLAKTGSFLNTAENGWATNDDIDVDITALATATSTLKTESSRLSSGLSIINTRQDWVKGMVATITVGADTLTLADMNEEGANMLMLQTRQTLGTTALSLSAQAAQSVLRLFA